MLLAEDGRLRFEALRRRTDSSPRWTLFLHRERIESESLSIGQRGTSEGRNLDILPSLKVGDSYEG
jgi:hypothetical protein